MSESAATERDLLDQAEDALVAGARLRVEEHLSVATRGAAVPAVRVAALRAGVRYLATGDQAGALELLAAARAATEPRSPAVAATVDHVLCWLLGAEHPRLREGAEALARGQRAREVYRAAGALPAQQMCEVAIGIAFVAEGEPALAAEAWRSAVAHPVAAGVWRPMAEAGLAALEGRPLAAVAANRAAIAAAEAEAVDLPYLRAILLDALADRLEGAGSRLDVAVLGARRALDALRALGPVVRHRSVPAARRLADLLVRTGRWDEGREVLVAAVHDADAASDAAASELREALGLLALRRGDLEEARALAERAPARPTATEPRARIPIDRLAARVAAASGDIAAALALSTRLRDAGGPQAPELVIQGELGRASAAVASGDLDMARRAVAAAGALLQLGSRPRLQTEFDHVRGKLLAALGRHEEAVVSLERARVAHAAAGDRYDAAVVELDLAAHAATTGCGADGARIGASADLLTALGSPLGPRLRSLARTLSARPGGGAPPPTPPLHLELLGTPNASPERILRTVFQMVCDRVNACVAMAERLPDGASRLLDRRGDAPAEELDHYEIRDRLGRTFVLSLQREPGRESPWLGTLLAAAELALEAAGLRTPPAPICRCAEIPELPPDLGLSSVTLAAPLAELSRARASRWPLLVLGEPGTGKRSLVRAWHRIEGKGPLVEVDARLLVDETLDVTLFGHRKSSSGERGLVREADGGTLLLAGLEALSPLAQERIERLLVDGEVRPVASRAPVPVSVFVVATARVLPLEIAGFSPGLGHRLAARPLRLAALRDHPEAILHLARHFAGDHTLTREARLALLANDWPGNVREIESLLGTARARAQAAGRSVIGAEDLG